MVCSYVAYYPVSELVSGKARQDQLLVSPRLGVMWMEPAKQSYYSWFSYICKQNVLIWTETFNFRLYKSTAIYTLISMGGIYNGNWPNWALHILLNWFIPQNYDIEGFPAEGDFLESVLRPLPTTSSVRKVWIPKKKLQEFEVVRRNHTYCNNANASKHWVFENTMI